MSYSPATGDHGIWCYIIGGLYKFYTHTADEHRSLVIKGCVMASSVPLYLAVRNLLYPHNNASPHVACVAWAFLEQ